MSSCWKSTSWLARRGGTTSIRSFWPTCDSYSVALLLTMSVLMLAQALSAANFAGYTLGQSLTGNLKFSCDSNCRSFLSFPVKNAALRPMAMALVSSCEDIDSVDKPLCEGKAGTFLKKDATSRTAELVKLISLRENGMNLALILQPWYEKVCMEEWNRIINSIGKKDWILALEVFTLLKHNINFVIESNSGDIPNSLQIKAGEQNGSLKDERHSRNASFRKAYTTTLTILARHRRIKEAQIIVREAKLEGLAPDLFFYNAVLGLYGSTGMVKHASETVKEMKTLGVVPDHVTYEMLIAAHLNQIKDGMNLQMALQVLRTMLSKDLKPGFRTFADLINACWEASQADKADAVFLAMMDAGYKPDIKVWIKMLQVHGRKGNHIRAEELFQMLRTQGFPLIPSLYENLLLAYCKAGRLTQALSVMRESKLTVRPSLLAYNILIGACAKSKLHAEALQLFVDVRDSGLKPNVITYTSAITALVKGGRYDKAEELYKQMQADNISPNIYTYTSMIHAYSLRGWTKSGDEVCMSLRSSGYNLNAAAYGAMLQMYLLGGWYRHAAKVLKEMEQQGHEPDTAGYGVLFAACGETGDEIAPVEKALKGSKWGPCRAIHTLLFSAVSSFETRSGYLLPEHISSFLKSYAQTKDQGTNLSLYNALMDALWRKGLRKRAQLLMLHARNLLPWYRRPISRQKEHLLDLRGLSIGGAQVAVLEWLSDAVSTKEEFKMTIVTGAAAAKEDMKSGKAMNGVKNAVTATLRELGSPFTEDPESSGWLHAKTSDVVKWLSMPGIGAAVSLLDSHQK